MTVKIQRTIGQQALPVDLNSFEQEPRIFDTVLTPLIKQRLSQNPLFRIAQDTILDIGPKLSVKELNDKFKIEGRKEPLFSEPTAEPLAEIKHQRELDKVKVEQLLARVKSDSGKAKVFGAELLAFALDPLNFAAFAIPGVRELKITNLVKKGSRAARLANREAVVGGVGFGVLNLANQTADVLEGEKFSPEDFTREVLFGGGFGAVGGALFGAIFRKTPKADFKLKTSGTVKAEAETFAKAVNEPKTNELLTKTALAQAEGERTVDVSSLLTQVGKDGKVRFDQSKINSLLNTSEDVIKTNKPPVDVNRVIADAQSSLSTAGESVRNQVPVSEVPRVKAREASIPTPEEKVLDAQKHLENRIKELKDRLPEDQKKAFQEQLSKELEIHASELADIKKDIEAQKQIIPCLFGVI